jgi:peptide/nickel transport system substrate-binding protein
LRAALAALAILAAPALAGAGVRPAYGGELVVALPATPRELDPVQAVDPADLVAVRALHATLVGLDAAGAPVPVLLAELPAAEAGGLAWRLRLRPGLRFSDGSPLAAADVAASLARLAAPGPHGWLALPIQGAAEVAEGRAAALRGVEVLSELELRVSLDFPVPELPWALAALPTAIVSQRGAGAGAFRRVGGLGPADARIALAANENDPRGRPFADRAVLGVRPARELPALLERGEIHLAVRPEAVGRAPLPLRPSVLYYAAVAPGRPAAAALRRALAALDRAALARRFVRGPSEPLDGLLPSSIAPGTHPPALPAPAAPPPARPVVILVPAGSPDARAAAERIQVKLFDAHVRATVDEVERSRFPARLAAGDHDLAIVPVPLVSARPALAAAQVAWTVAGPGAARRVLQELAGVSPEAAAAAADRIAVRLDLVPLFAAGLRASPAAALQGVVPSADGGLDLGDAWLFRGGAP